MKQDDHFMVFEEINVISKANDTLPIPRKESLHALYELYYHIEEKQNYNVDLKTMADVLRKNIRSVRRLYNGLVQKGYVSMRRIGNGTHLEVLVDITANEVWDENDEEKFIGFTDFKIELKNSYVEEAQNYQSAGTLTDIGIDNFLKALNVIPLHQTTASSQLTVPITYSNYTTLKNKLIEYIAKDIEDCIDFEHPLSILIEERAARAIADDTLKLMKVQSIIRSVSTTKKIFNHLSVKKEGCVLIDTKKLKSKYASS
ncbi:hypothetical protein [Vibrio cyclitrophicus]|uniref:hypothetical protein n=1 Tax=Vibrio cyclitrophicus TaxID=47951 RepID=UPI0012DB09D7|nr:hypothetical protein [Vibrio cyclitrophicus]